MQTLKAAIDVFFIMKHQILLLLLFISLWTNAAPYRYIVATDGSGDYTTVQAAINACPDAQRSIIFIKNGTYYGQTSLGTKASASTKMISLIGENRDSVILTYDKSMGSVATFELTTTFQVYAKNFYAENITFVNSAGNTGQALALYTAGDMATFKNCTLKGYQDTYRSKKGTRGYFKNCWIEGAVDFIYAGGTIFFDDCTINCVYGGGYITAPEDAYVTIPANQTACGKNIRVGFFFRNCNITANANVAANTYALGRPWTTLAGTIYINCKLGNHIKAAGWQTWNGNETTACFAEYNSMDLTGNPINISSRVSWSFQLPKADVDNLLHSEGIYARVSTTIFDPIALLNSISTPQNLVVSGNTINWSAVSSSIGYLVYCNGKYITTTETNSYSNQNSLSGTYNIYAVNSNGVLSNVSSILTATSNIKLNSTFSENSESISFSKPLHIQIFNTQGKSIYTSEDKTSVFLKNKLHSGTYILKLQEETGKTTNHKFIVN